jgi:hypothetical protein
MRREGHLRQSRRQQGEWRDSYLYAILEPDWRSGRARRRGRRPAPPSLAGSCVVLDPVLQVGNRARH